MRCIHVRPSFNSDSRYKYHVDLYDLRGQWLSTSQHLTKEDARKEAKRIFSSSVTIPLRRYEKKAEVTK